MTTTANRSTAGKKWTPNPAGRRVLPILPEEIETFEQEVERFRERVAAGLNAELFPAKKPLSVDWRQP